MNDIAEEIFQRNIKYAQLRFTHAALVADIKEAIAEAVASEREACVKLLIEKVDFLGGTWEDTKEVLADLIDAIQARGEKQTVEDGTKTPTTFLIDGSEHTKGADCDCSPKICRKNGCDGYLHCQAVYGPSMIYVCDKCEIGEPLG